jgi:predicted transcriptional regulator
MAEYKLGEIETIFADIIWDNEPVTSRRLTELAEERLNWKRTTTYTILKRLCDRELFRNEGGKVTSLVSREEFYARQSEQFVEETFKGSLPAFLAAFSSRKKLSAEEVAKLREMVAAYEEA